MMTYDGNDCFAVNICTRDIPFSLLAGVFSERLASEDVGGGEKAIEFENE